MQAVHNELLSPQPQLHTTHLQKAMMLSPAWPSAGPTGGAGLAAPALISSRMLATALRLAGCDIAAQQLLPPPP
jgi:hypothetical protein